MAKKKQDLPAITAEAMEDQMIALAMERAREKLRDGTASNALIMHFVRQGSLKERKQLEILEEQRKLLIAKTTAIDAERNSDEMIRAAMEAFQSYSGEEGAEYDE